MSKESPRSLKRNSINKYEGRWAVIQGQQQQGPGSVPSAVHSMQRRPKVRLSRSGQIWLTTKSTRMHHLTIPHPYHLPPLSKLCSPKLPRIAHQILHLSSMWTLYIKQLQPEFNFMMYKNSPKRLTVLLSSPAQNVK